MGWVFVFVFVWVTNDRSHIFPAMALGVALAVFPRLHLPGKRSKLTLVDSCHLDCPNLVSN